MVGVVVRQCDPAEATAGVEFRLERIEVIGQRGTGIDKPRRVAAHDPRVRPGQRERARVGGANPDDVVFGEFESGHCGHQDGRRAARWFHGVVTSP